MDDKELILAFKNGDEQAFNEIVNKYRQRVYHTVYRIVRNEDEAFDISQDVFIRAYKALPDFREDSSLFTWLYRIATNLSINHIKRNKFRKFTGLDKVSFFLSSNNDNPHKKVENDELREKIEEAIVELPDKQRIVFVLRYYENMKHKEIAKITNRSEGSVKANYYHALKKMKEKLQDYYKG